MSSNLAIAAFLCIIKTMEALVGSILYFMEL